MAQQKKAIEPTFIKVVESLGADGAIRKPLEQASFIRTVESMLAVDGLRV